MIMNCMVPNNNQYKMYELSFSAFVFTKEIVKAKNGVDYFSFHLSRCKNVFDTIKLSLLLIAKITYFSSLLIKLKEAQEELLNELIPKKL